MPHYNTTHETGQTLATYRQSAMKQEEAVLDFFRRYPWPKEPSRVMNVLNHALGKKWPITSIRRAMHDLTDQGLLVKTDQKVTGPLGRPEYRWRLGDGQ